MTIIKCADIPYLNEDVLEKYKDVTIVSSDGPIIKMNSLILVAMSHSIKMALNGEDDEHFIITEFSLEEIKQLKGFCMRGSYNGITESIVKAFALSIPIESNQIPVSNHCGTENVPSKIVKSDTSIAMSDDTQSVIMKKCQNFSLNSEIQVKSEIDDIKDEPSEYLEEFDYNLGYSSEDSLPLINKKTVKIRNKIKRKKQNYDIIDQDWKPEKVLKSKIKTGKVRFFKKELSDKDLKLLKTFKLPKALESYKTMPRNLRGLKKKIEETMNDETKKFQCTDCPLRVSTSEALACHIIKHHNEHLPCTFCNSAYYLEDAEDFKKHMFWHIVLAKNAFRLKDCIQCGKSKSRASDYEKHLKQYGPLHNDECSQCSKKMSSYQEYQNHVEIEHYGIWKYKCGFENCGSIFDKKKDCVKHNQFTHRKMKKWTTEKPKKDTAPPVCHLCGVTVKNMTYHLNYRHNGGVCNVCGENVKNVPLHMKLNHGETVSCNHCGKVWPSQAKLAKHIDKVHKKSQCPHCGDMVKNLSFHLKQHVPNDERPLKCDKCGKGFFQKHILEEHSNVHTGAKPFKCKYCPSAFASRGTHAMHERGHLGIKRKPKKT